MQHLRIGSVVNVSYVVHNSSGGVYGTVANGTVTNITEAYIEVENGGGGAVVVPWSSAESVSITTD